MSNFKKAVMKEAMLSENRSVFYKGMVYSYGQFYELLNHFKDVESLKVAFVKMAKELDIPIEPEQGSAE